MAVGLPLKTTYADGDVYSASDVNDTNGTVNLVGQTNNFYAGKNKIINGDFFVNQRGFTSTTGTQYMFDRWNNYVSDGTTTFSAQTFTPGTAPVVGYEARNFIRTVTTGQTASSAASILIQPIEDVRTLAGQTATISFWAKAASGTPKIAVELEQGFGTGGSPSSIVNAYAGQVTLSTSWARYSVTVAVPSISGKTIGTTQPGYLALLLWVSAGSTFNSRTGSLGIQSNTFDIWGVQVEAGSVATAFQTATGNLQNELAACQRYFQLTEFVSLCHARATTSIEGSIMFPVTMRVAPTLTAISAWNFYDAFGNGFTQSSANGTLAVSGANTKGAFISLGNFSGLTQGRTYAANAAGQGSFTLSAEL